MIGQFNFPYFYNNNVVENWESSVIGVYYLGVLTTDNKLLIYYIGRAVGDDGIRGRLLQHLSENKWNDVMHFGYHICDTPKEAMDFETKEISKYSPKYNKQGIL